MRDVRIVALSVSILVLIMLVPLHSLAETTEIDNDPLFTQRLTNHYGAPVSIEVARKVSAAAVAEGKKHGWALAVAVVDPGGTLVYFERMDGTQSSSPDIAIEKARAAVAFKRSTKLLEDRIVAGRLQYLRLPYAMPIEGGVPLIIDNLIVGAIAVSGSRSEDDGVAVRAAVQALRQMESKVK